MSRYLLVLHDLGEGAGLVAAASDISREDPGAEFVLLVPATAPAFDLFIEPQSSPTRLAARHARRVRDQLVAAGVNLLATRLGNFDPFRALADALRFSEYAAVIIAAPEHKLLHLLRSDLTCRLARRFRQTQVIHAPNDFHEPHAELELQPGSLTSSAQH